MKHGKLLGYWLCVGLILMGQEQLQRWGIDPKTGHWRSFLAHNWMRFALREVIVYAQLWVGYLLLRARYAEVVSLRNMFVITTVGLDVLFLLVAAIRGNHPEFQPLIRTYNQLNYSLGSGVLVVFFYGLGLVKFSSQAPNSSS